MPRDQIETEIETLALPGGSAAPVVVRRSVRARRITLRMLPDEGAVELVLPGRTSKRRGMEFAASKAGWVAAQIAALPVPVPFECGARIPLMGEMLTLRHVEQRFRDIRRDGEALVVSGPGARMADTVENWLRMLARREIGARALAKAAAIDRVPGRITLRDTRTRWGSCTEGGNLNFSWRLVMTPEHVMDYVVAHEVAHLAEFNHSRRFWRIVGELCETPDAARRWLRDEGPRLYVYGLARRSIQAL
jgi:predicted metal-dependent hydrolase